MFLLDDILLAPLHGIMMVFREIHHAANQEKTNEAGTIRIQLSELYMELETGRITEEVFDRREGELLDRLDAIEGLAATPSNITEPSTFPGATQLPGKNS